jgi:hypothetical protein
LIVDLETICLKCLEKDASKRYGSGEALAEDLQRFLNGEPIQARPIGQVERFWRWCRRNTVIAGLAGSATLFLFGGIGISSYFAIQANWQKQEAFQAKDLATKKANEAMANADRVERVLYYGRIALAHRQWQDNEVGHARDLLDACRWDLRGWEHSYLRHLLESKLTPTYTVEKLGSIPAIAFSPDGKHIASSSYDHTLKVWDTQNAKEVFTLKGHTDSVWSVAFSPDGIPSCAWPSARTANGS